MDRTPLLGKPVGKAGKSYENSQPITPPGVVSLDKVTQERLAQANGRLRAGNVGVVIRYRGLKLYLRAMLPPKPGSPHDKAHQQEIAIGARANPAGVSVAEKEARKVGSLIESKEFSWLPYLNEVSPARSGEC